MIQAILRVFLTDRGTRISFLIDTGADLCVYPRKMVRGQRSNLITNFRPRTVIHTYGTETMTLNLGLRRMFTWRFVVAEHVSKPIIEFLAFFGLFVDVRNNGWVNQTSGSVTPGRCVRCDTLDMKRVTGTTRYQKLLAPFPDITKPGGTSQTGKTF